ncbi:MAG: MarR family transcriptional regulator [Pseudomonadota bacterium]
MTARKKSDPAADAICQFVPPFLRFLREGLSKVNVSPARFQIMQTLSGGSSLSMAELADRLSVTKRNITTLVDGLERDGLASRHPHPTDRRSTLVELTPEGNAVLERAAEVQREHLRALLANLDAAQQRQMTEALNHLMNAMVDGSQR